jgi:hypothetical protein
MSGLRPRGLGSQTVWPALAGAAQAASIAWPSNGQALGWLQVLSLTLLAAGLARMAADLPSRSDGRAVVVATHEQVAASCGISRPKASIALKALEDDGVLKLGRGWIEVLNLRGLIDRAG